ncbi:hypothetical protein FRC03_003394 [Tulasnella sp. 419]|nr:hypothetical protein FRC03_003394 [Tulasnella sp. 419]
MLLLRRDIPPIVAVNAMPSMPENDADDATLLFVQAGVSALTSQVAVILTLDIRALMRNWFWWFDTFVSGTPFFPSPLQPGTHPNPQVAPAVKHVQQQVTYYVLRAAALATASDSVSFFNCSLIIDH